jgi:hypothetical protein
LRSGCAAGGSVSRRRGGIARLRLRVPVRRVATDTKSCEADDLSGAGAKVTGERWDAVGDAVIYTPVTQALACLETVVHLNAGGLPLDRLARFDVLGREADRELIRALARRLAEEGPEARLRAALGQLIAGEPPKMGGILAALRRSPLVGADVDFQRPGEVGRSVAI